MTTARTIRHLVSAALCVGAAAACDRSPTAPRGADAPAATQPTTPAAVRRAGNAVLAGGYDADTTVRHAAARWAAEGRPELQAYVDSSAFWDGPHVPVPAHAPAPAPVFDVGPTADSFGSAVIIASETKASANGTSGIVTTSVMYWGSEVHTDMRYSAMRDDGSVVVPDQTHGFDDSNSPAKSACAGQILSFVQPLTACANWNGTAVHSATLSLGSSCGVSVHGSASYLAYFELPIIVPSFSSGGVGGALHWARFGDSPVHSDRVSTATNGTCPVVIAQTPTCSGQIIYDPTNCDTDSAGAIDDSQADSGPKCQTYLVTIEESYDKGRTWVLVASYFTTIC